MILYIPRDHTVLEIFEKKIPNPWSDHSNSKFELQYSKWPEETLRDLIPRGKQRSRNMAAFPLYVNITHKFPFSLEGYQSFGVRSRLPYIACICTVLAC